ncbi:MAG TPA: hypothetical protein VGU90_13855, partial [Terriglobales bacterium]|nr:hypothetical protein [Terriglobales bacterium]
MVLDSNTLTFYDCITLTTWPICPKLERFLIKEAPPVDVYEDEHNVMLKIEVPGIDEKDIDVRVENNTLT